MTDSVRQLEEEISAKKKQLAEARMAVQPEAVGDHTFQSLAGPVSLAELFGDRDELLVVHNMGRTCPYCTLWADGLNGLHEHLENRAAFVVVSPDGPAEQKQFADSRGWRFRMVSDADKEFTRAMGYLRGEDWWPGISGFVKGDGLVLRTGTTTFGPGDDFCGIWPAMELLGGDRGWEPKYRYS